MKDFIDVLKDSIAQSNLLQEMSPTYIKTALSVALLCGIGIYLTYRIFYRGACYSDNFGLLLVMTSLVTAFIIMTISSNIVMSLGMVGALSIVRFRSAVKDPLDVGFLFWSVASGLTAGAGLFPFSIIGTIFIAIAYVAMTMLKSNKGTYLLIIHYSEEVKDSVTEVIKPCKVKLKNLVRSKEATEVTYQIKVNSKNTKFIDQLLALEGVTKALLVEFVGDN